jgi:REP element-mobilizing transposase RayT
MGYHPRIETDKFANFLTTRSRNSELWFINNSDLEEAILGYTARCAQRYSVKLYAIAIEGNHIQATAHFPTPDRANFMRDLNSCVARAVSRCTPEYPGGRFWARRYSNEFLPGEADIERLFIYNVLQPVQDGLVEKISDYPGYSCLHDAAWGIKRKYKVVRWAEFNAARRRGKKVSIKDFKDEVTLEYARLPGYEHLSQKEYALLILAKVEARRVQIVAERRSLGLGFAGRAALLAKKRGSRPYRTKTSTRESKRPRIISVCRNRREAAEAWYFAIYFEHRSASKRYRQGEPGIKFPSGTYPPPRRVRIAEPQI